MALRILHTADWHIGKRLYGQDLTEDHRAFFDELMQIIEQEAVTHLLISGDVFDLANPSHDSLQLYYEFLERFIACGKHLIITGGNHDSPGILNGPKALLDRLRVTVIGSATDNLNNEIIELVGTSGKKEAVIAAVPYLRDRDLRRSVELQSAQDRIEAIRNGIRDHYHALAELCQKEHPDLPALAMGHLYAQGAESSESEREIQIGNQAGIDESVFHPHFSYVALGHIHKPQNVGKSSRIRYSGSPISLSFSEKDYQKRVILIELNEKGIIQKDIPLSSKRRLLVLEGTISGIEELASDFRNDGELMAFAEIRISENNYDPEKVVEKDLLANRIEAGGQIKILLSRITFLHQEKNEKEDTLRSKELEEIDPIKVLQTLTTSYSEKEQKEIDAALMILMEEMQWKGGAE